MEQRQEEQKHDIIDTKYNIKKFFKLIYRDKTEEEFIRVFQDNKTREKDGTYSKVEFFNDIDDLVKFSTNKYIKYNNTYFTLSTTDGQQGNEEHLLNRYCISLDFDKKDLGVDFSSKDILNKFKAAKIHYHCLVDSGNGFHVYICINKTNNIKMVQEVQEALCDKLGADKNAIKSTQILRVPYSFNIKDYPKRVKIIAMDNKNSDKFRPYDIEFLYKKNCINEFGSLADDKQIKYTLNNTNVPRCIENILNNGTLEGDRYQDLQRIVVMLRQRNKPLGEIIQVCKEWAIKSQFDDNLDYRINNIYDNLNYISMDCKKCEHRQECYSVVMSDFEYSADDKIITMNETHASKLKASKRKGAKIMKPNDLLVYSILKCHNDGLTREEILKELTYTKKKVVKNVALSDRTLKDTLKSLEDNGFIECTKGNPRAGIQNIYKLKECTSKIELTYNVSYSATFECVKGNISTEELRMYNYMRYLHHKEQRENPKALKGNLFQFNQVDLAEHLGLTQGRISQMIDNLLDEKLLGIWYRQASKNNGFEYNVYRLMY